LHRDLDIVLFDTSTDPRFLNIFPYGVLREPMASLKRAHMIILTRSQGNDDILVKDINQFTSAEIYRAQFDFSALVSSTQRLPVSHLSSKSVSLFAGIGNFMAFTKQVTPLTRKLDFALELADHQQYSIALLRKIRSMAERFNSDCLVTTYKDWVKFGSFDFGRETYYLDLKVELDPPVNQLAMSICDILKLGRKSD
jgi:tetraacyldisaccharide 4'-kinase